MLTIVDPRASEAAELAGMIAADAEWEDPTVKLFVNDETPGQNSVDGDFTLADNTAFPGYATSTAVVWAAGVVNLPNGRTAKLGGQKLFIASANPPAPLLVYGYILTGATNGRRYVKFEEPITILAAGDYVPVDPMLTVGSMEVQTVHND